jgi:hypothetical protein
MLPKHSKCLCFATQLLVLTIWITHALAGQVQVAWNAITTRQGEHRSDQSRWHLPLGWMLLLAIPALLLASGAFAQSSPPLLTIIAQMPEGTWREVNQNAFSDVWPPANLRLSTTFFGDNIGALIRAWGSFAWDSNRGDLILYGGGHANYGGNDVYRWRSATLRWERAALASQMTLIGNNAFAVDGPLHAPPSAHTYDNSLFLPISDRFLTFGGASFNLGNPYLKQTGPSTFSPTGPYLFDPSKADPNKVGGTTGSGVNPAIPGGQMWQNRDTYTTGRGTLKPTSFINGLTAYASENGKDVVYVAGRANGTTTAHLYRYTLHDITDPTQDTWERVGYSQSTIAAQGAGAYDPTAKVFVRTGDTTMPFLYWDLNKAGLFNNDVIFRPTDATGQFQISVDYGIDYDPLRDQFVLWGGTAEVWALHKPPSGLAASGWTLTREALGGAPGPGPLLLTGTAGTAGGVLGKWHYAPDLDVFIGLRDAVAGEVWVYKPHGWQNPLSNSN